MKLTTCLLLAMVMIAKSASSDPGKVAVDFLEKVRVGKLDLAPGADTAISPQTADGKKRDIAKRLERMAKDLGADQLEIGAVRLDEDFAGVLVRKVGGFDPNRLQVFPVALVKRDGDWAAAPVPASFENAGTGYAIGLRKRLEVLENWMLREQVVDLVQLREQAASKMRAKIQESLRVEELKSFTMEQAARRYLSACEKRDLPSLLGMMGGLSNPLPDDWTVRLKAAEKAISAGNEVKRPWRLLTSVDVLRVVVNEEVEENQGKVSLVCLDPSAKVASSTSKGFDAVSIELSKNMEGLWQVDPTVEFLESSHEEQDVEEPDLSSDLIDQFAAKWRELHPEKPQPTIPDAQKSISSALSGRDPGALLQLAKLDGAPSEARMTCGIAAQLWGKMHDPATVRFALPLMSQTEGDAAAVTYQLFLASEPERLDLTTFYLERVNGGWIWNQHLKGQSSAQVLDEKIALEMKRLTTEWQQLLLSESSEIKELSAFAAPSPEASRRVVEGWLKATAEGDVKSALALTARLADPSGNSAALRNMGHEIAGGRKATAVPAVLGVYTGKIFTAVGVNLVQGGRTISPLYPVLQTAQGPRVLIDVDLFASRGRDFLNKVSLAKVKSLGSEDAVEELKQLYDRFRDAQNP